MFDAAAQAGPSRNLVPHRPRRGGWPNGAPLAAYREQTVEIALGAKGAFENGNIRTLTRQVPADRVINALPPKVRNRKPPKAPRTPRVVELLRKALEWQALLESGEASNQAEIARREGITRARVTQIIGMLRLAAEIQQQILSLPEVVRWPSITERALRPIAQLPQRRDQLHAFQELLTGSGAPTRGRRGPRKDPLDSQLPATNGLTVWYPLLLMNKVENIESQIKELSSEELAALRETQSSGTDSLRPT